MAAGAASIAQLPFLLGRFSFSFLRRSRAEGGSGATRRANRPRRRFRMGKARWVALVLLALFMGVRVWDPGPLQTVRLKVFDFYQQMKPRPLMPNSPVVIVDLDEKSLETIGQWPWPRNVVAQMTANLFNMGVGVVGFDVFFT